MLQTCLKHITDTILWIKIKQKYLQIWIGHASSFVHFCKQCMQQGGMVIVHLSQTYNKQEGTTLYNLLILDNKQFLSNMIRQFYTEQIFNVIK